MPIPDNCPFVSNPTQTNSDTAEAGDDCQCGNVDSLGGIDDPDLQLVRGYLMNGVMQPPGVVEYCNVTGAYNGGVDDCTVAECGDGRLRVKPGAPEQSYLIHKLLGFQLCSGEQMPRTGSVPSADIEAISAWICGGAPNN